MKILIAVPTFENIAPETFKSVYDLDKAAHAVVFEYVKGYDCAKARNMISKRAISGEYDYVLMVDSDMVIPSNALTLMLESTSDLVLGCYPHKNSTDHEVELFADQKDYKTRLRYPDLPEGERIPVKGGGFGCALINVRIYKKLKYPYFKYVSYDNGTYLSEDLYFCSALRRAGGKIEADTRVRCGHIMKRTVYD